MTEKAYAYVARPGADGPELPVFTQPESPQGGIQVSGGTVDPGESPEQAAVRELLEESGVTADRATHLGTLPYFHKLKQELQDRHYFLVQPDKPLPDSWTHSVSSKSADHGMAFDFFWLPVTQTDRLAGRLGELAYLLSDQPGLELRCIVSYLLRISRTTLARNKLPMTTQPDYCVVFCRDTDELARLTAQIEKLGTPVEQTPTGTTWQLREPIAYENDAVSLVKLRKPDTEKIWRGDIDYRMDDRAALSRALSGRPDVKLISRPGYEMLELTDRLSDALIYFSDPPLSRSLRNELP